MPTTRANSGRTQGLVEVGIQQVDSQKSSAEVPKYGFPLSSASSQSSHTSGLENIVPFYPVAPSVDHLIASHQGSPWDTFAPLELDDSRRSSQDSQHYATLAGPASSQALQLDMMRHLNQSSPQSRQRDFGGTSHSGAASSYAALQEGQATMHQMTHTARHPFGSASSVHSQGHTEAAVNMNVAYSGQSSSPQGSAAMYAHCSDPSRGLGISSADSQFQPIAHSHSRHASFDHMIAARHQQEHLLRLQAMTPIRRGDQRYLPMSAPGNDKRLMGPNSAPLMSGNSSRMSSDRAAFLRTLSSGNPFMSSPPSPGQSLVSPSVTPSSVFHPRGADSTRHSPITPASFGDATRFFGPPSTMASSRNSMSLDESFTSSSGTDRLSRASSLAKESEGGVKRVEVRRLQGKKRLTVGDRKLVCQRHLENPTQKQEQLAREFGVERSTVSKILKEKEKWLSMPEDSPTQATAARSRPPRWPDLEQQLGGWMFEAEQQGVPITDSMIRQKALEIAQILYGDIGNFKGSQGWIEKFKERAAIARHGFASEKEDDKGNLEGKIGKAAGGAASGAPVRRHRKTRTTAAALRPQQQFGMLGRTTAAIQGASDGHPACPLLQEPTPDSQAIPSLPMKRPHSAITSHNQLFETPSHVLKHEDFFHLPESPIVEPARRRRRPNAAVELCEHLGIDTAVTEQHNASSIPRQDNGMPMVKVEELPFEFIDPVASSTSLQPTGAMSTQTPLRRVLRPRNRCNGQRESRAPSSAPAHQQSQKQAAMTAVPMAEECTQGSTGATGAQLGHEREHESQPAGTSKASDTHARQEELAACSGIESDLTARSHFSNSSARQGAPRVPFAPDSDGTKDQPAEILQQPAAPACTKSKQSQPHPAQGEHSSIVSLLQARSSLEIVIRYLSQVDENQDYLRDQDQEQVCTGIGAGTGTGTGVGREGGLANGLVVRRHFLSMGSLQSSLEGLIERETRKAGSMGVLEGCSGGGEI